MESSEPAKLEVVMLLCEMYGDAVGKVFQATHAQEVIPVFVHSSYMLLKQNMGGYKAGERLDKILSKHGIAISSYD
jgi:hypothetical protein